MREKEGEGRGKETINFVSKGEGIERRIKIGVPWVAEFGNFIRYFIRPRFGPQNLNWRTQKGQI